MCDDDVGCAIDAPLCFCCCHNLHKHFEVDFLRSLGDFLGREEKDNVSRDRRSCRVALRQGDEKGNYTRHKYTASNASVCKSLMYWVQHTQNGCVYVWVVCVGAGVPLSAMHV